jgi:putative ABC transport system permease protein
LVLGTFAVLALGLTALGIFAAVASFVAARTRELGVRLALGASPQLLIRSTVVQSLAPVVSGVVLGVIATEWLRRIAATQLIELPIVRHGALTMGVTVVVVAAAALAGAYFPARYASRIDPAIVLRAE